MLTSAPLFIKPLLRLILLLCLSWTIPAMASTLSAIPDRTVISEDETLALSVRLDRQIGFGGPDFSLIEEYFEILNRHTSNQFRSINGRTEGWTEWNLTLAPKRTGKLLIPSFTFEDAISDAIEITVNGAGTARSGEVKDIFVEMEIDKEQIFVQEQLLVTYRIFSAIQVREISLAESLTVADANAEVVAETSYRKRIQGRSYRVSEITYAIHPQKSEPLQIPSLTWNLVTASGQATWFNDPFRSSRGRVRRLRTEPRTVAVNPKPANYTGRDWIPAQSLDLEQHWSSDPSRFVVGEPITRTLTLTAKGLAASQIPTIPITDGMNIKTYADQPQLDQTKSREGITGVRIETSAIVPTQAGELMLEPIDVNWWDTINKQQQVVTLPAQVINVAPAAANALNQAPLEDSTKTTSLPEPAVVLNGNPQPLLQRFINSWALILSNTFFALLSLAFFIAWVRAKQAAVLEPENDGENYRQSLKQLLNNIRRACADNDVLLTKQALGPWAQQYWQLSHIASLQDIIKLSGDKNLGIELERLDQLLYGRQIKKAWQGQDLWLVLFEFQKQSHRSKNQTSKNQLRPLYPSPA